MTSRLLFDKLSNNTNHSRYHDHMFDRAAKAGHAIKQRRGAKKGNQSRPEMERRSSSLPPDNELQRLEEGRERGMGGRQGGRSGYGNDQRSGRRDRVYVDDHGEDYYVVSFLAPLIWKFGKH
jgi:hypothetical protein